MREYVRIDWATLKWQRPALRAGVVLAFPVIVALLARELGYLDSPPLSLLPGKIRLLDRSPFGAPATAVMLATALLALIAVLHKTRAPQFVMGLCVSASFWLGFVYSDLRWYRLVPGSENLLTFEEPTLFSIALGLALLFTGVGFAFLDSFFLTRESLKDRALAPEEIEAATSIMARGLTLALLGGLGFALAGATIFWLSRGGASALGDGLNLNPVVALLSIGVGLVLILLVLARARRDDGTLPPLFRTEPQRTLVPTAPPTPLAGTGAPEAPTPSAVPVLSSPAPSTHDEWIARELARERK